MSPLFDHYGDPNMEPGDEYEAGTYGLAPVMIEPDTRNTDGDGVTQAYGYDVAGNNETRVRFGMPRIPTDRELDEHWVLPRVYVERLPAAGPTWNTPYGRRVA